MSQLAETQDPSSRIADQLARAHQRIDHLLAEVDRMAGDGEWERCEHTLRELAGDLDHHIRVEEEVLFPIYEARAWRLARATAVMRHEHGDIRDALARMQVGAEHNEGEKYRDGRARLESVLPAHHLKEERILYAAIDAVLTEGERRELAGRL